MDPKEIWEPYFRPTSRTHDSGFGCFECGYLQVGNDKKATKKVVIWSSIDHITNWMFHQLEGAGLKIDMDLLKDGHIRLFNNSGPLFWSVPGFSDAEIVDHIDQACPTYADLDELYEAQRKEKE